LLAKALAQAIDLQLVDEEWRWHKSAQDKIRLCSAVEDLKHIDIYP
jgi:hypothetical protein